ncbi:MAG: hypothetical protein ABSC56_12650 [Solirubrobacteraceae bacterium]
MTVLSAAADHDAGAVALPFVWWVVAGAAGFGLGWRGRPSPQIARLLMDARSSNTVPEQRPAPIMLTRLWPLLIVTLVACVLGSVAPQIPGIAAGFPIISALAWRHQFAAVLAIEGRDGVRFYVDRRPFWRALSLTRTPGFKVFRPVR